MNLITSFSNLSINNYAVFNINENLELKTLNELKIICDKLNIPNNGLKDDIIIRIYKKYYGDSWIELETKTVKELKVICKELNISQNGIKYDIILKILKNK